MKHRPRILALLAASAVVGSIALSGCGSSSDDTTSSAEASAVPTQDIASKIAGRVLEVTVEEGQMVEAGAVVARLDDRTLRARLLAAEAHRLPEIHPARVERQLGGPVGQPAGPESSRVVFPVPEGTWVLTSPFGMRVHPITGERKMHTGTDFAAPDGTPILAAADGTVTVAEFSGGYGGLIVIEHIIDGKTVATAYAHMWQSGIHVRPGDRVSAGQHIGDVGSSGMSTGAHLHFEVRPGGTNGEAIDAARAEGHTLAEPDASLTPVASRQVSMASLFKAPYTKRTIMLWLLSALEVFGYYGFGTVAPLVLVAKGYSVTSSLLFVALSYLGYPLGSLLAVPIVERIERKYLVMATATLMAIFGLWFGFASSTAQIIAAGFLYSCASNLFSNAYHVYLADSYPTAIRGTAAGAAYSLSKLVTAFLPFILLPVLEDHGSTPVFVIVAVAMGLLVVTVGALGHRSTGRSADAV